MVFTRHQYFWIWFFILFFIFYLFIYIYIYIYILSLFCIYGVSVQNFPLTQWIISLLAI